MTDFSHALHSVVKLLFLGLCSIGLPGCTQQVFTKVNAFKLDSADFGRGEVVVRAADSQSADSLEFAYYRGRVEAALANLGYEPVRDPELAEYETLVSYGVAESDAQDRGLRTGFITPGYSHFHGVRTGVMVIDDTTNLEYVRKLSLTISRREPPERIYEVTGYSRGRCGVFSVVFDEMLEALLKDFPAESGSVRTIGVGGESRC